jgi:hypothetical protein
MDLPSYFTDVAAELERKSQAIRRDFATHRGAGGSNRENLIADVLRDYLPREFGIDTGLITAANGQFSNQSDLIVTDHSWNAPFYPSGPNRIWLVEAVYALLEVKTNLTVPEIADAVNKCRRFKALPRNFSEAPESPRISGSLFIIWSYECPASETLKANLAAALSGVPAHEQPDFVIVPGRLVATSGQYREISALGEVSSEYRRKLQATYGPNLELLAFDPIELREAGQDSLLIWLVWVLSWLKRAGSRNSELLSYLPPNKTWGKRL